MDGKRILRTVLTALAVAAGVWLFAAALLPLLLPFLIGLGAACVTERPVQMLTQRGIARAPAAFLCVLILLGLFGTAVFFLCRLLCTELSGLLHQLPALTEELAQPLARMESWLQSLAGRLPDGLGTGLRSGIDSLFRNGSVLGTKAYSALFAFASGLLEKIPGIVLFCITTLLASFMTAAELPALRTLYRRRVPSKWQQTFCVWRSHLRRTLGHWLRAQLKLLGIVFLLLTAGLMLLGLEYPLLFALLISCIDALPVFGTGTVLIPWGLLCFLRGQAQRGVGFFVLYGVAALTRQALEPRLLGQQIGLPPLVTLMALYVGFRLLGVTGMILFPIAAVFLKQVLSDRPQHP